jgi:hypothetical protein
MAQSKVIGPHLKVVGRYKVILPKWDKLARDHRHQIMDPWVHEGFTEERIAAYAATFESGYYDQYTLGAEDPEHVFCLLNIEHPEDYHLRSLSVGDLIINEAGRILVVAACGMEDVTDKLLPLAPELLRSAK